MMSLAERAAGSAKGGEGVPGEIVWTPELNLGIELIDEQHKSIVRCCNEVHNPSHRGDRRIISQVLAELVHYTDTHFEFEEYLLRLARYPHVEAHHRVHGLFIRKLQQYHSRFEAGEEVANELSRMLKHWLFHHILTEDRDYLPSVQPIMKDVMRAPRGGLYDRMRHLLS